MEQSMNQDMAAAKVVFMHGFTNEEAVAIMRAVKAALADPGAVAFSVSTPSNLEWKVADLVREVAEEHAQMTGRKPGGRPA